MTPDEIENFRLKLLSVQGVSGSPKPLTDTRPKEDPEKFNEKVKSVGIETGDISYGSAFVKSKDQELKDITKYIPDPAERESLKVKALSKISDIVDFLDNFNRVGYAVAGMAKSSVKNIKEDIASVGENKTVGGELSRKASQIGSTFEAGWKGLTREERTDARDVLKEISPEFEKTVHDNTKFKVLGIEGDALSVPLMAASIAMDPVSWIPFGAPLEVAKGFMGISAKGMETVSSKVIGEALTKSIADTGKSVLIDKIYPLVNLKGVFRNAKTKAGEIKSVERFMDIFLNSKAMGEGKAANAVNDIFSTGEKTGLIIKSKEVSSIADRKDIMTALHDVSDLGENSYIDFQARKLKVATEDIPMFRKIEGVLGKLSTAETGEQEQSIVASLNDYLKNVKRDTVNGVVKRVMEEKGLKSLANGVTMGERDATIVAAKYRLSVARDLRSASMNKINTEIAQTQKALKSGINLTSTMLAQDIESSSKLVRGFATDFGKVLDNKLPEGTEDLAKTLETMKRKIQGLTKYQADVTKGIQGFRKSDVPMRKIESLIRNLELDVGKQQAGVIGDMGLALKKRIRSTVTTINSELNSFKSSAFGELQAIKGNVKASAALNAEIVDSTKARLQELMRHRDGVNTEYAKELALKNAGVLQAVKKQVSDSKRLFEGFSAFNTHKWQQETFQEWMGERNQIVKDYAAKLRPEIKEPFLKARAYLDEFASRASEGPDPLLKGWSAIYAPREIQKEFLEKLFPEKLPQFMGGSKGHFKHREFTFTEDYRKYVGDLAEQAGIKKPVFEDDAGIALMHALRDGEMNLARHNAMRGLVDELGYDAASELPAKMKKQINFVFGHKTWSSEVPLVNGVMSMYGKGLNLMKMGLTSINPAFNGRNILTNPLLAVRTNGFKALNPMNWAQTFMITFGWDKAIDLGEKAIHPGKKITMQAMRDFAEKSGSMMTNRWSDIEKSSALEKFLMPGEKNPVKKFLAGYLGLNGTVDDMGRYGAALAELKNGKTLEEAFASAKKAMIDFNLLNSPADKTLQGILGFYTFSRRNIERELVNTMNNPAQYAILSRVMGKISNREALTNDEINSMSNYERSTFKFFGDVVDGTREFTSLGFFPQEDAYQTLNSITSGDLRKQLGSRVNPLVGSFLNWYYSKDSFTGKDFGNYLPPKYTSIIPETLQKVLGLTAKDRPQYRAGQVVGTETVLYGDPDRINLIRNIPIASRFISDLSALVSDFQEGNGGRATTKYLTGITTKDLDPAGAKRIDDKKVREALRNKAKSRGAQVMDQRVFIPKKEKEQMRIKAMVDAMRSE